MFLIYAIISLFLDNFSQMAFKYHPDKNSVEGTADILNNMSIWNTKYLVGNDHTRFAYHMI
jgi:hypothetical protein